MGGAVEPDRGAGGVVARPADEKGPTPERRVAYDVVRAVHEGRRADEVFARVCEGLPERRRPFAMELAYGTIRWRGRLDHDLDILLDRGVGSVSREILSILELGAYQLRFMESVPARAAVDEAVELTKTVLPFPARGSGSRLVNGVLRNYDRRMEELEPSTDDPVGRRAIEHSHPPWMVERWLARLGPERTDALLVHDNAPPALHLALPPSGPPREELVDELRAAGHDARPHPLAPHAVVVESGSRPEKLPGWDEGRFWIQDAASQWVVEAAGPVPGDGFLDACAAPGTKLVGVLARAPEGSFGLALDPDRARLVRAREAVRRLHPGRARLVGADARHPPLKARFALVLADVPCSGTGALRRRVDARWRRRPGDPDRFAAFQREILSALADHVVPGGVLVYSTCSVEREENRDVVEAFTDARRDFRVESLETRVPAELRDGPYLFTGPWSGDLDGMFAARLIRESEG